MEERINNCEHKWEEIKNGDIIPNENTKQIKDGWEVQICRKCGSFRQRHQEWQYLIKNNN